MVMPISAPNTTLLTFAFSDNFFTRPRLGEKLSKTVSDNDIYLNGTCKFSNIDSINQLNALQILNDKERDSWLLRRSYSFCKEYDKKRKKFNDIEVKTYKNPRCDDSLLGRI